VKDKEMNHTWIIDIAVPGDARIEEKDNINEEEKRKCNK